MKHMDVTKKKSMTVRPHGRRDFPVRRTVAVWLAAGGCPYLGDGTGCDPSGYRAY